MSFRVLAPSTTVVLLSLVWFGVASDSSQTQPVKAILSGARPEIDALHRYRRRRCFLSKKSQFPKPNDQGNPKLQIPKRSIATQNRSPHGNDSLGFGHWSFIGHWVLDLGHLRLRRAMRISQDGISVAGATELRTRIHQLHHFVRGHFAAGDRVGDADASQEVASKRQAAKLL